MMLGCASQSCVRSGDKAGQRYQKSGGEAHRISFEHVSHRRCGDFHCFVYAFHWPSLWLHDATIHRMLAKIFSDGLAEFTNHLPNVSANMGRPLFDCSCVASSSITSQCSTRTPSLMRTMSAAIQFTGRPKFENRPCTITNSRSATIVPGSYLSVGGRLLMRLNRPSRPGLI